MWDRSRIALGAAIWLAFMAVGMIAFFAVPWYNRLSYPGIFTFGFAMASLVLLLHWRSGAWQRLARRALLTELPLPAIILVGLGVRLLWLYLVPPAQLSDARDFLDAALRMVETGEYSYLYQGHVLRAWRPPGYPFLLAASIAAVGNNPWIPAFWNLLFFVLTAIFVYRLAQQLGGRDAAAPAALAVALWPSLVAVSGLAVTEPLSLLLVTGGAWLWLKAQQGWLGYALLAGVVTGYGALARPSLLMFPAVWILYLLLCPRITPAAVARFAVAVLALVLTVLPWAVRNYQVLGEPIAISSNGGDVFYRANNPLATGTWSVQGERDLSEYMHDEVQWNRMGYAWGKEWVSENPWAFAVLSAKKVAFLLGADDTGAYWTLQRGHGEDGRLYQAVLLLSNGWWLWMWISALVGAWVWRGVLIHRAEGVFLLGTLLYFVAVHAVFESQPRYHLPMLGILAIFAALAVTSPRFHTASAAAIVAAPAAPPRASPSLTASPD